jgi:hypothetical protein
MPALVVCLAFMLSPLILLAGETPVQEGDFDDSPVELRNIMPDTTIDAQTRALGAEVERMRNWLKFDKAIADELKGCMTVEIELTSPTLSRAKIQLSSHSMTDLDENLHLAFWKKAIRILPEEMGEEFLTYQQDAKRVFENQDRVGRQALVVYLDQYLCLTPQAMVDLEKVYSRSWNRLWNDQVLIMIYNQLSDAEGIFNSARKTALAKVFTADQLRTFERLQDFEFDQTGETMSDLNLEEIRSLCLDLMGLKIAEIDAVCELSEAQKKKLSILVKGTVARVVSHWAEFSKENTSLPLYQVTETPLLTQCIQEGIWSKSLIKTLDPDQLDKWRQNNNLKTDYIKSCTANLYTQTLEGISQINMTSEEHTKLFEMILQKLAAVEVKPIEASFDLNLATDEEFEAHLPARIWKRTQNAIQQLRAIRCP